MTTGNPLARLHRATIGMIEVLPWMGAFNATPLPHYAGPPAKAVVAALDNVARALREFPRAYGPIPRTIEPLAEMWPRRQGFLLGEWDGVYNQAKKLRELIYLTPPGSHPSFAAARFKSRLTPSKLGASWCTGTIGQHSAATLVRGVRDEEQLPFYMTVASLLVSMAYDVLGAHDPALGVGVANQWATVPLEYENACNLLIAGQVMES